MAAPRYTKLGDLVKGFARRAAVGDADHDFSGSRSDGGSIFSYIFKINELISIGAPDDNLVVDVSDEYKILSMIFPFNGRSPANVATFQNLIKPASTAGNKEHPIGDFTRFDGDSSYTVVAAHVASKVGETYTWYKNSTQLYDFMNPHNRDDIAFTIDACNVKFYKQLVENNIGTDKVRKAYYLLPREGINDAAGKVDLRQKAGVELPLKIETRDDTAPYSVLYPALTTNAPKTELECFFSNYNISLSAVSNDTKTPSVVLNITDKGFSRQIQILKHSKEDAHPNAVNTLSSYINKLKGKLIPGAGNETEKMSYYAALQQKRSGDWLQVLSCLQPERFQLPSSTRPMLFTLDKICVAYALFAGIDVCMTYWFEHDGKKNYYLIRFHKNVEETMLDPVEKLKKQVTDFYTRDSIVPDSFKVPGITGQTYNEYKSHYGTEWANVERRLLEDYNKKLGIQVPRASKTTVENIVKDILYSITTVCVFRTIVPELKYRDDNVVIDLISAGNQEQMRNTFSAYRHNYMAIKEAIEGGIRGRSGIQTGQIAINNYFSSLLIKNGILSAANKKRRELIDKLKLFGGLFSRENAGTNGVGIFSFLNQTLKDPEKDALNIKFKEFYAILGETEKDKYKLFLDTLKYLTPVGGREVPVPEIVSSDLLLGITKADNSDPTGNEVTAAEIAATDAAAAAAARPAAGRPAAARPAAGEEVVPVVEEASAAAAVNSIEAALTLIELSLTKVKGTKAAEDEDAVEKAEQDYMKLLHEIEPTDARVQVADSIQVSDYGPAVKILANKQGVPDDAITAFKTIIEQPREEYPVLENQGGGGSSPLSKYKYYHNPLTSFYFMFRELGWRLTQPDRDDHEDCIRLSKLLEEVLFNTPRSKYQQISNYLYWLDLEKYLLYFDSKYHYTKCDPYFIDDIMFTVREVYLSRPAETEEKYYIINESIIGMIQSFSFDEVSNEEQIQENLKIMRRIIDAVYKVEEFFDAPLVAQPVKLRVNTSRNQRRRLFNSPKNRMPVPVASAVGGSLRKHRKQRKTKSKRRHNRRTKKRKNFVV